MIMTLISRSIILCLRLHEDVLNVVIVKYLHLILGKSYRISEHYLQLYHM